MGLYSPSLGSPGSSPTISTNNSTPFSYSSKFLLLFSTIPTILTLSKGTANKAKTLFKNVVSLLSSA